MATVCIVWEFQVRPEYMMAFEYAYDEHGEWARLFRQDSAYIRSDLLHNQEQMGRYLTLDHWKTREAYQAFSARFRNEYPKIDDSCWQ
ncbi:MAG TPA: antibiotic biosynthesis monooxygenase [Gammaproteobacteria bacterium]|nr:antibiotic biosynthesis monooxygenase [Gammaproteobacteria bacterium]